MPTIAPVPTTPTTPAEVAALIAEVIAEIARQDTNPDTWGQDGWRDGTGPDIVWCHPGPAAWVCRQARDAATTAASNGAGAWRHVLTRVIAEAYAESDRGLLRRDLVQAVAATLRWLRTLDHPTADQP